MSAERRHFQIGLKTKPLRMQRQNNILSLRKKQRENKLQEKRKKIMQNNESHIKQNCYSSSYLIQGFFHHNPITQYSCVKQFRICISKSKNPLIIHTIFQSQCIPQLIKFCCCDHFQLQYESLWSLSNITSENNNNEAVSCIIKNQGHCLIQKLIQSSQHYQIQAQSMLCFYYILFIYICCHCL